MRFSTFRTCVREPPEAEGVLLLTLSPSACPTADSAVEKPTPVGLHFSWGETCSLYIKIPWELEKICHSQLSWDGEPAFENSPVILTHIPE